MTLVEIHEDISNLISYFENEIPDSILSLTREIELETLSPWLQTFKKCPTEFLSFLNDSNRSFVKLEPIFLRLYSSIKSE